jgi:hypothetical protein
VTLSALGQQTRRIWMGTTVTCPTLRYNPAVVAQAFASLSLLYPEGNEPMTRDAAPEATHRPMKRGEFLKNSLLLMLVGASCLLSKERSALAADVTEKMAQGAGQKLPVNPTKPALTEENLNQFIDTVRKGVPPDSEALKTRATRDWRALLRDQFALTPTQKRALEVLPKKTVQQVEQSISQAIRTNSALVVRAVADPGAAQPMEQSSGGTPSPARIDEARIAELKKPGSVECTKSDGTYQCTVKAGVVC